MADQTARHRELVYCHQCENEWYENEYGLQCPECDSLAVEIIEADSDPRQQPTQQEPAHPYEVEEPEESTHTYVPQGERQQPPQNPFNGHNPWEAPDPDEEDIDHIEFHASGTLPAHMRPALPHPVHHPTNVAGGGDPFSHMFNTLLGSQMQRNTQYGNNPRQEAGYSSQASFSSEAQGVLSPLQGGEPFRFGATPRMTGGITVTTRGFGPNTTTQQFPIDDLAGIFGTLLGGMQGHPATEDNNMPPHPFNLLSQIFNPANARSGDAVFTNEALDRVITQLMEQHSTSNAPGPASDVAIAALPKIKVTLEHFSENGKAECSICMDELELGAEVTQLPCKHWFHGECVGAWLREHDTCPQCRRGITPKEGDANTPRATGEAPRFWQMSESDFRPQTEGEGSQNAESGTSTAGQTSGVIDGNTEIPSNASGSQATGSSNSGQTNRRNEGGRNSLGGGLAGFIGRFRRSSDDSGGNH